MKPKITLCLALILTGGLPADARFVRSWSDPELMKASDLVVVATPLASKDLDETNSLGWSAGGFHGVETTFRVFDALKGMPANDHIILHHYRYEIGWGSFSDGPDLVGFTPNSTNKLVLYLIKDGTNRYAPVTGQADSSFSIRPLPTNHLSQFGMPSVPPMADADPSIRHLVSGRVPTRLKVERTADTLSVTVDTNSFESTNLTVGTNMVTGVQSELYIYPVGEPHPTKWLSSGLGGTDFNLGTSFWHTKQEGIPLPGKKYVVELDLTVFETDIPPQHEWSPWGKNYKVLWRRTLKQTVE